jgi:hypothetical protein
VVFGVNENLLRQKEGGESFPQLLTDCDKKKAKKAVSGGGLESDLRQKEDGLLPWLLNECLTGGGRWCVMADCDKIISSRGFFLLLHLAR